MAQRKFKYWINEVGITKIRGWAQQGLSDEQIAHNIDIHVSTLYDWKNKYPELNEAMKKGKEVVDLEVENALLKSALGQVTALKKVSKIVQFEDDVLRVKRSQWVNEHKGLADYEKYTAEELNDMAILEVPTYEVVDMMQEEQRVVPNPTAMIFWLKNRRPDLWRDKQIQELQGEVTNNVNNPFAGMTKAEIREIMRGEQDN